MNYLGLDFGTTKVGVALATGQLAEPLTTLDSKNAIRIIKELAKNYKINTIVVGQADKTISFGFEKFVHSLDIGPWTLTVVDETLSSYEARQKLFHTTQKRRKKLEHQVAAAIILQNWLDLESIV
jgi:putative transcription antitermination factor YqgF